jgi:hypothetical protein
MLAMFLCGVLTIIACAIFVKKEAGVSYKPVDNVSLVLNFLIGFMVIPFIIIAVYLLQITINTEDFIYQIYLCIPALTAFTIAASLVLRRKGFTKSGLLVQFIGPILFFIPLIFESLIYNFAM